MTIRDAERIVRDIASGVVEGDIGIVQGCRGIVALLADLPPACQEIEELKVIVGVSAETDDFPLGDVRQFWATDTLSESDAELARYLEGVAGSVREACRRLVEVLGNA
jgi:hypothetical protein